jgi:hypothetical protein
MGKSSDPRAAIVLPRRDSEGLRFIGEGYEVAQYQLHEAVFRGLSPTVVSRFVRRWKEKGFLASGRLHGFGMNRLRLTAHGRTALVSLGIATDEQLFVPRRPVALKDLAHTLWVNDGRIVLRRLFPRAVVLPAWALGRLEERPPVVPDILALARPNRAKNGLSIAVEVDLGSEPLTRVFLPKLAVLRSFLQGAVDTRSAVVILTNGPGRRLTLKKALRAAKETTPVAVELLPNSSGREGLIALERLFSPLVDANAQPEDRKSPPNNEFTLPHGTGFGRESEAPG